MPKWLHDKLKKQAKGKGLKGDRAAAYIYSVLNEYEVKHKGKKRKSGVAKPKGGRR